MLVDMSETPVAFMIATFAVLIAFFVVDLFVIGRKPHVPSTKECVQHIAFFVVMALIFGGLVWCFAGSKPAIEFYSGWLTEYSLSIDNLFVFVIIMSNFAVPKVLQKYVLSVGITVALILRGCFILVGAAIVQRFTWVFFLFGAFLIKGYRLSPFVCSQHPLRSTRRHRRGMHCRCEAYERRRLHPHAAQRLPDRARR